MNENANANANVLRKRIVDVERNLGLELGLVAGIVADVIDSDFAGSHQKSFGIEVTFDHSPFLAGDDEVADCMCSLACSDVD